MSWGLEKLYRGETALGERAPYFDRKKATLGFTKSTGFCFASLPLAFLAAGFGRCCLYFLLALLSLCPPLGFSLFLGFSGASPLPTLALCREVEVTNYSFRKRFLGQVVVYDVPCGIWHIGS